MSDAERGDVKELAAAYVLGALNSDEAERFEAELRTSESLRNEVAEYREVSALLALDLPETHPDDLGWQRVRQKIARGQVEPVTQHPAGKRLGVLVGWGAAAAAAVVAIVLGMRGGDLQQQLNDTNNALDAASARIVDLDELLDNMLAESTEQFVLNSPATVEPGLRVYWNRDDNVMVLQAFQLEPPAVDRVYQLWFIQDDGVIIPSDTFTTTVDGRNTLIVAGPNDPARLNQAAVSIEPVGGSQQPTGTIVLAGAVGQ